MKQKSKEKKNGGVDVDGRRNIVGIFGISFNSKLKTNTSACVDDFVANQKIDGMSSRNAQEWTVLR